MTGRKTVISAITGKRSYGSMTKGQKQTPDIYGSLRYTGAKNAVDALIKRNASKETTAGLPWKNAGRPGRYTYRSLDNVTAQSVILAIAHNINKYHNKIQSGKTGQHLFEVKKSA